MTPRRAGRRPRRERGLRTVLLAGAIAALLPLSATRMDLSGASYSASSANPGNSLHAAASFATMRLATGSYVGNGVDNRAIAGAGFQPSVVIVKGNNAQVAVIRTSTMAGDASKPAVGALALASNGIQSLDPTGFTVGTDTRVNQNGISYQWVAIRANPNSLVLGSYTGNGAAARPLSGLGFQPEYVAVMSAAANNAVQRFAGMTRAFRFDADTGTTSGITSLDANGFSVGSAATVNANGTGYHYMAFNQSPEAVGAGSYTGNAVDNRNVTGLGLAPQYVLVRANDSATARRGVHRPASLAGDSTLNFTAAANFANSLQALQADGFQLGTDGTVNANGVAYHYLALRDDP